MQTILFSTILLAFLGIFVGIFLGIFSKVFKIKVDEREEKVRNLLPGNNCGGCGYPGCDGLAHAIVFDNVSPSLCSLSNEKMLKDIALITGGAVGEIVKKVAFVHCNGSCKNTTKNYIYDSSYDCNIAKMLPNKGDKSCSFSCIGFGNCVRECKYDAISIIDGVAVVNEDNCIGCGKCQKACPNNIISIINIKNPHRIKCNSKHFGKDAMSVCKVSCIGCKMCEKNCEAKAITMVDNLPVFDYKKCTNCGICAQKCPRKCIT